MYMCIPYIESDLKAAPVQNAYEWKNWKIVRMKFYRVLSYILVYFHMVKQTLYVT